MIKIKPSYILSFSLLSFMCTLPSCGKANPPSPLYQIQSTKIQNEIQKRSEKKKND